MLEIDKSDFLYKHLTLLGEEDVEKKYLEYANLGIATLADFKKELYNFFSECYNDEPDEEELYRLLPYFDEVKKIKQISQTEFNKLIKSYKENTDSKIFNQIVNSKLKDVILLSYMYKLKMGKYDLLDILQTANIGLIKAVEKYYINSKIAFDEYMYYWIRKEIENAKENLNG